MKINNFVTTEKVAILLAACPLLLLSLNAGAATVIPSSYTTTPGEGVAQNGTFNYFDDTGSQLTDGIYGVNNWKADLGNGNAQEWVGWRVTNPVITFNFPQPVTINTVGIDFNRTEPIALIYLPSMVNIGGTDFAVGANALLDGTHATLNFAGSWTGTSLTVTLTDNDPHLWIFVDEIKFSSVAVPEPSALVLTMGAFSFLFLALRVRGRRDL